MASSQEQCITDPAQLQALGLAIELSNSSLDHHTATPKETTTRQTMPPLRLALLQPLADPAIFAACCSPAPPKPLRRGLVRKVVNHGYLDIDVLSKAWRYALVEAPPASNLTFDLRLPETVSGGEVPAQTINWSAGMPPRRQEFCLSPRSVARLVVAIATVARMRVPGDVHFKLSYPEANYMGIGAMDLLASQLKGLERAKDTAPASTVDIGEVEADTGSAAAAGGDEKIGRREIQPRL